MQATFLPYEEGLLINIFLRFLQKRKLFLILISFIEDDIIFSFQIAWELEET